MDQSSFNLRFTATLFIMAALLITGGYLMQPGAIQEDINLNSLAIAHENQTLFIWSFRVLVFGNFMAIMALVSLGSLMRMSSIHPIIQAGIFVCCLALLVGSISEAYFMDMGAWGGWKVTTLAQALQESFVNSMEVTYQWVSCFRRMSYMFFCLGLIPIGLAITRDASFPKALGYFAMAFGAIGIAVMLIDDSETSFYPIVRYVYCLFFVVLAGILWRKDSF
ncbi:MAG: hypothetical protein IPM92_06035 [Saprospiraceae bacterium]|nr:hypothetical protein [Saprospiraceae bacterium]